MASIALIPVCNGSFVAWDDRVLCQLPPSARAQYETVFTWRGAIDTELVESLRTRTCGNTPTALFRQIESAHETGFQW